MPAIVRRLTTHCQENLRRFVQNVPSPKALVECLFPTNIAKCEEKFSSIPSTSTTTHYKANFYYYKSRCHLRITVKIRGINFQPLSPHLETYAPRLKAYCRVSRLTISSNSALLLTPRYIYENITCNNQHFNQITRTHAIRR